MAERRRLLEEQHEDVFGALPISDTARAETLRELVANLTTHAPQWFSRDGDILHNALTSETWDLAAPPCDPLELAGRLVQEDPASSGKARTGRYSPPPCCVSQPVAAA